MRLAKKISMILCEDIREEKANKLAYLGVFGIENTEIILDEIPGNIARLCLAIMLSETNTKIEKLDVTVLSPGLKKINFTLPGTPQNNVGKNVTLGVIVSPFKVAAAGEAKFEIKFNDEKKPSLIFRFKVILKDKKTT